MTGTTADGKPASSKTATTKLDGTCVLEKFLAGVYTIEVSGTVETKTFGPFELNLGKETSRVLICTPAFNTIPPSAPEKQTVKTK